MTTRRLKRLKQLATGTALMASTLSSADEPPTKPSPTYVNSPAPDVPPTLNSPPPAPQPKPDAGVETRPGPPIRLNSPGLRGPSDAGAAVAPPSEPVRVNSPPPKPKKQ